MKKIFLLLCIGGTLTLRGQEVREWLSLTPIPVEKPAFSEVRNVKDQEFTADMLVDYAGLNVRNLVPDADKSEDGFPDLRWSMAQTEQDTVVAASQDGYSLNYYAVYFSNADWISGKLNFRVFGTAEIYVDGVKKADASGNGVVLRQIPGEWIPGKHSLIVKSLTKGGKVVFADFEADREFEHLAVEFSVSPKHGKTIYEVLNGKRIGKLDVSPTGKYAIVGIANTVDGKTGVNTYVYRIADKELMYTFYGYSIGELLWMPGKDCLSFFQNDGNARSLYSYDLEKQEQHCLIREDMRIKNYVWSPDCSYLIYYDHENYGNPDWKLRKLAGMEDRQDYFRQRAYLCKYDFSTGMHSRLT